MTTLHDFGGVLGRPLDTFSQLHGHSYRLLCEVALSCMMHYVIVHALRGEDVGFLSSCRTKFIKRDIERLELFVRVGICPYPLVSLFNRCWLVNSRQTKLNCCGLVGFEVGSHVLILWLHRC